MISPCVKVRFIKTVCAVDALVPINNIYLLPVLLGDLIRHIHVIHMRITQRETRENPNYMEQVVKMITAQGNFVDGRSRKAKRAMICNEPTATE